MCINVIIKPKLLFGLKLGIQCLEFRSYKMRLCSFMFLNFLFLFRVRKLSILGVCKRQENSLYRHQSITKPTQIDRVSVIFTHTNN